MWLRKEKVFVGVKDFKFSLIFLFFVEFHINLKKVTHFFYSNLIFNLYSNSIFLFFSSILFGFLFIF